MRWWPFKRDEQRTRYNEFEASGAAVFTTTYGDPNVERILPTFASYAEQAYAGDSIVFGAILARLQLFSEAELIWQNRADERLFGNADLARLEEPWPNGTTGELLARAEQDVSLAGNFYLRDAETQYERLRPDRITIVSELVADSLGRPYRQVIGYGYDRNGIGRAEEFYLVDEVAHWSPIPDPCAQFRGMSWLTPVIREVLADQGMTEFKIKYMEHAATPNVMVRYDKSLKPETITSIEDRLSARHGGVANAYKTIVLDQGADFQVIGNSLEQVNFTTVQAAGENRILIAAGTPGIVVGSKEGLMAATYSNYQQAMRRFSDITMRPNWRSFCGAIQRLVTPPPGARLWFNTRNIAALQAGEQERAGVMQMQAATITALINAGYEPDSVIAAVSAGDPSLLVHSGRFPTSVYQQQPPAPPAINPPGDTPPAIEGNTA